MRAFILFTFVSLACCQSDAITVPPNESPISISESLFNTIDKSNAEVQFAAADECVNNSLDTKCDQVQPQDSTSGQHRSSKFAQIDNQEELAQRIRNADQLKEIYKKLPLDDIISLQVGGSTNTLRQVFFLHRHGDRTPVQFPPKDTVKNEPFWSLHGLGQLTNRGKARLFLLGKIIRARYNDFMNTSVNKNKRISRSSGSLRCIESAQVFLSSFLALNLNGSIDANNLIWDTQSDSLGSLWQPASIQSVPELFDGMLAEGAKCDDLIREYNEVIDHSDEVKKISRDYKNESDILMNVLGFQTDHFYKWFWASSQIEVERSYFPDKMSPEILAAYDRIQDAGNLALIAYQSTLKSRRLRSGLLMNDIVSNMLKTKSESESYSSESKKFLHYSAHDMNLIVILGMLDAFDKLGKRPDYASNIAIELHLDRIEWFVKIFYMEHTPSQPIEIHIKHCEDGHPTRRCTLVMFEKLMRPYMINSWQDWMKECKNDLTLLDPYNPGK